MSDQAYPDSAPAYAALCRGCNNVVGASIESIDHAEDVADFVADAIRRGDIVERKTVGEVKEIAKWGCTCPQTEVEGEEG